MITLTVKETISKLKEANPNPRKLFTKKEVTTLVTALLSDDTYAAKEMKVKNKEFVTEDRHLAKEFKAALTEVLVKQLKLSKEDAEKIVADYKAPKSLVNAMIDTVNHANHLYMTEVGKAVRFLGTGDTVYSLYLNEVGEKTHRIPLGKDGKPKGNAKAVKVAKHARIAVKNRVNPSMKTLLQ